MLPTEELINQIDLEYYSDGSKRKEPVSISFDLEKDLKEVWKTLNLWWYSRELGKEFPNPNTIIYDDLEKEITIYWLKLDNEGNRILFLCLALCENGTNDWFFYSKDFSEFDEKLNLKNDKFQKYFDLVVL